MEHILSTLTLKYGSTKLELNRLHNDGTLDMTRLQADLRERWRLNCEEAGMDPDTVKRVDYSTSSNKKDGECALFMKKQFKGRCRNCGQIGHKAAQCPKKKQEGNQGTKSNNNSSKTQETTKQGSDEWKKRLTCFYCKKKGHVKADCRKWLKEKVNDRD